MSAKYFIANSENSEIEVGVAPTKYVQETIESLLNRSLSREIVLDHYKQLSGINDYDLNVNHAYSVKLGCFVEINGKYSLESEFNGMADMIKEIQSLSLNEIEDCIFTFYIYDDISELESDNCHYDTIAEKYM